MRALRVANLYLWSMVPVKVQFLRPDLAKAPLRRDHFLQTVWQDEKELLQELRVKGRHFKKSHKASPHSFCASGWWKASALADCNHELLQNLRFLKGELPALREEGGVPDLVPPHVCRLSGLPEELAAQHLAWSHCLADAVQFHVGCAYSLLFAKRDLVEAAAHLQIAALNWLVCDGCRVDGSGFGSGTAALDDLLWRFGLVVPEVLALQDVRWEQDPARYALAATAAAAPAPAFAWRGSDRVAPGFGRSRCQALLRPPLCVQERYLVLGDFAADSELLTRPLPSCHYERQKPTSVGLRMKPMSLEDARAAFAGRAPGACTMAAPEVLLLAVPVHPQMTQHFTSAMIWFLGALAWFHGPTGKKLLAALWAAAGSHPHLGTAPAGLFPNTTEVVLVPSPGRNLDPNEMLLKELFGLLSEQPVRSLLPYEGCRCYRRGAVWGVLEAPFSGPGDLAWPDSSALRAVVSQRAHQAVAQGRARWSKAWESAGVRTLLVERCSQGGCPKRNVTNFPLLTAALRRQKQLALAQIRLHELPLLEQVQVMLETQVMLAVFGATLAWIPLMQPGSYVIELHPGPPESLTLWGSCWTQPYTLFPSPGASPGVAWDVNPRSEFGSWARAARVHYACVAKPAATNRRCLRTLSVEQFEVPSFEVDVDMAAGLALDAARRLSR
ncbi:unnamed protein product [Effrenium voratum]|uniref:Uncharacterized protein n=1 Tax=Effrenium voratum TaxID=2562239 RepID=A0AA36NIZ0_9DINO|nr:unnamed protein product [Effrenium voratum]